jgi:uncharacterized membrane protein
MIIRKLRAIALGIALIGASASSGAWAHNDPREMGAGPGTTSEAPHTGADGHSAHGMSGNSEMKDLANEGTAPTMADGSSPGLIEDGAMEDMDHQGMAGMEGMDHDHAADNSNKSFVERLFIWLGKLHTVVIHFPIAMIVAAFGLEVLGIVQRRQTWRSAARAMLVVGAIGAVVAASLGWFAGGFYLTDRNQILTVHRYLGMAVTIASVVLAWAGLRRFHHEKNGDRMFGILLGVLTLAVLIQAFLGGTFMHGGMNHMNF